MSRREIDLSHLADSVGQVRLAKGGPMHDIRNPSITDLLEMRNLPAAASEDDRVRQALGLIARIIPSASPEEIGALTPLQMAAILKIASEPNTAIDELERDTAPNATRGAQAATTPPATPLPTSASALRLPADVLSGTS